MNNSIPTRFPIRVLAATLAAAILTSALAPGLAETAVARNRLTPKLVQNLANTTSVTINDNGATAQSSISVSGFDREIADVDVTLNNLSEGQPGDLDFLLVGPGGQTALIVSDVGTNANRITLTLDDQAANQIASANPLASGTFQPTNFQSAGDTFAPPAPTNPASGSELGVFNSTDPNGTWNLFVRDDGLGGGNGELAGGWSLRITSANGVPNAEPDDFQARAGSPLTVPPFGLLANDQDPDGDTLTAVLAGKPRKGTLQLAPDGSFTYRPNKRAKGTDSFTYLAKDPSGLSDLETATIQITGAKKRHKK